jgi:hypothetical protein
VIPCCGIEEGIGLWGFGGEVECGGGENRKLGVIDRRNIGNSP